MKPIIIINLKTYKQGTGKNALQLTKMIEKVAKEYDAEIIVAAQDTDIRMLATETIVPIYAQAIEPVKQGSTTGHVLPEAVKEAGAVGTLMNHSEHRERIDIIEESIKRAHEAGLHICVCANTADIALAISTLGPEYVAMEPPELIGGDVSVSKAKPELISETVKKVNQCGGKVGVLVGAGVKNAEDLRIALKLGAQGVLLASGVVCAQDPEAALRGLLEGLK